MEKYGVDSIAITQINHELEKIFGNISKTLFYQYQTIDALSNYLISSYSDICSIWGKKFKNCNNFLEKSLDTHINEELNNIKNSTEKQKDILTNNYFFTPLQEPLCIIGISGYYPKSDTLDDLWNNIKNGKNCITEIPKDRWPINNFFEKDRKKAVQMGKSYSKWGGFLNGFANFDSLFFNISPKEALDLDPQERLFLQCAWHVLEDAGLTRENLCKSHFKSLKGKEKFFNQIPRVGVFVGVTKTGFDLYGPEIRKKGKIVFPHTSFSSIANRVSYFLNLSGPSMPIDTMCSSSLTAIHEACQHIRQGECDIAIAGGVNLYLHPSTYINLCSSYMLSNDGKCRSFGKGGNGFVPGEGVGAVLIKRLSKAIIDRDSIYAIIRGSSINHGGKTNGYTVPNPNAQTELIYMNIKKSGINARAISYVEAHGTGTELGDPIEITGLTEAFRRYTMDIKFCSLGSIKSNLGHLEAAAGIAGLSKIILQMRYKKLVPSLHAREINPNINLETSPFFIQQKLENWNKPVIKINNKNKKYPRIASLSSFGAGGSNAHLLVEEYISTPNKINIEIKNTVNFPIIILLTAKNKERLKKVVTNFLIWLKKYNLFDNNYLKDIAYTLQVGREHMDERLGIIIKSIEELKNKLNYFLKENVYNSNLEIYTDQINIDKDSFAMLSDDAEFKETIKKWIILRKFNKLLPFWVKGLKIDWEILYLNEKYKPKRIQLPLYPFKKYKYWMDSIMPQNKKNNYLKENNNQINNSKLIKLLPVWDILNIEELINDFKINNAKKIIILGGNIEQKKEISKYYSIILELNSILEKDISTISNKFHDINKFDHIVWIVPVYDINNSHKNNVIIQLFRLIKVLLKEGYENIDLKITIVTIQGLFICDYDEINPHHASIHGLVSSIAQEYPMWSIKAIDMINNNVINWSVSLWYQLLGVKNISIARRKYNWFFQKLIPLNFYISKDIYRKNGIYLVIGGAGGVGSIWSEFMIKNYEAKIIWIGRSPKNNILQEKINNISIKYNGICPIYIQADARNSNILFSTYQKIKKDFDHINGIVVSTLSDYDLSFKEMSEDLFINILSTKHDVSLSIEKCFYKERLDFIIYFSSMISFEKPGGMSAYVSSCTFSDAFSKKINKKWDCVVKTINWGYWNIGGGIRISSALKKLIEKRGVESINKEEGMNILKLFLGNITEFQQLAITRTNKPEFINIYSNKEFAIVLPNNISNIEKNILNDFNSLRNLKIPLKSKYTEELNYWIIRLLFVQLRLLGIFKVNCNYLKKNNAIYVKNQAGILDKYIVWWKEILNILHEYNYLITFQDTISVNKNISDMELSYTKTWMAWKKRKTYFLEKPETHTLAILVNDCLKELPKILHGDILITDILFPNGSMEKIEGLYKNNCICDYFNDVVSNIVNSYIKNKIKNNLTDGIKIIEIGAGTGGTTSTILKKLEPWSNYINEYCYTDISKSFLNHAYKFYGSKYPYLVYKLWNIEKSLISQDINIGDYDIVIATNVLHATKNIRNTIRNVKAALKINGIAILNEISNKTIFASVLFGLIDGWSLAEDTYLRIPGSPGLYAQDWFLLLQQEGYHNISFPVIREHKLGQQIIVAHSNGIIRQNSFNNLNKDNIHSSSLLTQNNSYKLKNNIQNKNFISEKNIDKSVLMNFIQNSILNALSESLIIQIDIIKLNIPFSDYGIDSILGVNFIQKINNDLKLKLNTTILFDYTTVDSLSQYIITNYKEIIEKKYLTTISKEKLEKSIVNNQNNSLNKDNIHSSSFINSK
ncbi:uncharacterized protein LOC103516990 isoform X1 [Diaphorina citri]|nr:uncharacterized protein LOC103516990 isoform X1 [Diaphorina citri]